MYKILHLAAHYGGGVGSIVQSWIENDHQNYHTLTYLNDSPENYKPWMQPLYSYMIGQYDIVVVHVWNHPALFHFLEKVNPMPCRMIGWSHMAGTQPPYILFDKLKNYFDEFYYTSPISGHDHDYIWSSCDIDEFLKIEKRSHFGLNVGYIGTIDFCKMHPDFNKIVKAVPEANFTVIGGGCDLEKLKKQCLGLKNIRFTGQIQHIHNYLSEFDVFLYPLNPMHQGTCEQVIGESMAAGLIPIVLKNDAEKHIIQHNKTGLICNSIEEMTQYLKNIPELDINKIRQSARDKYSVSKKIKKWNDIFDRIIKQPKKTRKWESENHIFIESLGPYGQQFLDDPWSLINKNPHHWRSEHKGSPKQYLEYFPDDKKLQEWVKLL